LRLTVAGQRLLKRAKVLAAVHETRLVERLGADQRRSLIDTLKHFGR
jgi:hypothetical protein